MLQSLVLKFPKMNVLCMYKNKKGNNLAKWIDTNKIKVKYYTIKDSTDTGSKDSTDSKDNTDRTDSTHSRGKIKQEMANEMDIEMVQNTFKNLANIIYAIDSAIALNKKETRNIV